MTPAGWMAMKEFGGAPIMSQGLVTETSASANLHTVAPSHRHAEPCVPPPPLRHSTDTYDFKLLKKARGKQSKTRAD